MAGGQKGRGFRSLGPQEFLPARRNFWRVPARRLRRRAKNQRRDFPENEF